MSVELSRIMKWKGKPFAHLSQEEMATAMKSLADRQLARVSTIRQAPLKKPRANIAKTNLRGK